MAELPARFYVHRIAIEPLLGTTAYGDEFGDPIEIPAWVQQKRRYVRNGDGIETLSEASILCDLDFAALSLPGSLVTLHTEIVGVPLQTSRVITQSFRTDGGFGVWQHLGLAV